MCDQAKGGCLSPVKEEKGRTETRMYLLGRSQNTHLAAAASREQRKNKAERGRRSGWRLRECTSAASDICILRKPPTGCNTKQYFQPEKTSSKTASISLAHPDGAVGVDGEVDHLSSARRSRQGAARPHHDSAADVVEQAGVSGVVQELRGGRADRPQTEKKTINGGSRKQQRPLPTDE